MTPSLLLLLAACGGPTPEVVAPPRPPVNVLLITLDTLRADALGVYGHPGGASPNLDALAAESARFTRAYTVTPLTIPAHSSIMTGLLPPRHGVRDNGDFFLSEEAHTLAERFKEAGYRTMASVGAEVTSHHWGFAQGFDAYHDDMGGAASEEGNRWKVERRGDAVVDDALAWLSADAGAAQPFFAWVHLFDVHHPYAAPEPYRSRFQAQPYLGEVAWTDSQVGRLLGALRERGLLENTAVIVTADHGEGLGSHGENFHGVLLYDPTTRVPLLVRPPGGLSATSSVPFPVSLVDLAPTALAMAGLPAPQGLDGMDLSPWVVERVALPAPPLGRAVYLEALYGWRHYGWAPQRALVTDDAKLIDSTTPELYGREDMAEADNRADRAASQVQTLQARIAELYASLLQSAISSSEAELSPERIAQLEALGYVTSGAAPQGEGFGEGLPDPVSHLPSLRRLEEARAAVQAGDLAGAEKMVRALVEDEPGLAEASNLLASVLARQSRIAEAIEVLRAVDERRPSSNTRATMGTLEMRRGRVAEAVALLGAAIEQDPFHGSAWTPYLTALFLSGDMETLGREVARARQNLPELASAVAMQGVLLAYKGDTRAAAPLLRQAVARDPLLPLLSYGLGLVAVADGRVDDAESAFLEELRVTPPALYARRELVKLYAGQKRYEEQLGQLEVILRLQPKDPASHHSRAQALYNLKRYPEAEEGVLRCLELAPRYAECKMLEANVLKRLGREAAAEAAYQEALRLRKEGKAGP